MRKPLTVICCAAAAILTVAAFLWAQSTPQRPTPSHPVVLAMQEPQAAVQQNAAGASLSKMSWLGLMYEPNPGHGVRVGAVFPAGPAAFGRVRVGDILLRVGGTDVNSMEGADAAIEGLVPQQPTTLTVERRGRQIEIKVIPETMAEFQQDYISEMMRRDPRDPNYGKHHGVSEADMSAELVRRIFEQHERLDRTMNELLKEVHALRKQVAALQNK
jgi:predicted metalloprotease with PDZ domain